MRVRKLLGLAGIRRAGAGLALAIVLSRPLSAVGPRFFPDDPIAREPDPADASRVQPFEIHIPWDVISSLFVKEGDSTRARAQDVNTIDEVPDSSWFTNRLGTLPMSATDVARGPDTTAGPAAGVWTVVAGKSEGAQPGFTIVDSAGVKWFLKFDHPGRPEQYSGAEVVSTKLFWALGYNVPETHIATLRRANLVVSPDAHVHRGGTVRRFTARDIDAVLTSADRGRDGGYRVLASKAVEGKPVGEFSYYGTRPDDPNDVIPHENRRELRGMRVFAAWIDRWDAKPGNTFDTVVSDGGRAIVRHYVLDFGNTLGNSGGDPYKEYWEGNSFLYEGPSFVRKALGFGWPIEPWRTTSYPRLRGVGRITADHFDPDAWKTLVPNAAYLRADRDDLFWAARKLSAVTDAMIAAAVRSGEYSDNAAQEYLIRTLIERRDLILRRYLPSVTPIVNLSLDDDGTLTFQNLAVDADVSASPASYRATWYRFDNVNDIVVALGTTTSRQPIMNGPTGLPRDIGSFVRIDLDSTSTDQPARSAPVSGYFRRDPARWTLVGFDRAGGRDEAAAVVAAIRDQSAKPPRR